MGRSGCGKGTQAGLLMNYFKNLHYIVSGDLLRSLAEKDTLVGKRVKDTIGGGRWVPGNLPTMLVVHEISNRVKEGEFFIIDGVPRKLEQAKELDTFLDFIGQSKDTLFLLIDISREEAFSRLTKRRICKVYCRQKKRRNSWLSYHWSGSFNFIT